MRDPRSHRLRARTALTGPTTVTIGAAIAGQLGLVVSGVIAARALGVTDRGHLALIVLLPSVLAQLIAMGLPLAVTFQIASRGAAAGNVFRKLRRTVATQLVTALIASAVLLWILFEDEREGRRVAAAISILSAVGVLVQMYALAVLQGQRRFLAFNIWRTIPSAGYAAGAACLAVLSLDSVVAFAGVWTGITVVAAGGTLVAVRRKGQSGGVSEPASAMRRFGWKAFLGAASPLETYRADQLVVGLVLAPAALGLYVTAIALTNLPRFVAQSIGMVAYPSIAAAQKPHREAVREAFRWTAITALVTGPIVIALEIVGPDLIEFLFGEQFLGAVDPLQILLVGAFLLSVRRVLSDGLNGANLPGAGSIGEVVSWVVFVPLAILLTASHGVNGVAVAVGASALVSLASVAFLALNSRPEHAKGVNPAVASPVPVE